MTQIHNCKLFDGLKRRVCNSNTAWRPIALVALVGGLSCTVPSAQAVILQTGNFLQNPGAEFGSTLFWTTGGDAPSPIAVESSSVSLSPGGSISPTEGTRFFVGGSGDMKTAYIEQEVSVSSFDFSGGLTTVSYGGDAQGITNRVPHAGSARAQYDIFFLDSSSTQIGTHSSGLVLDGSVTPEANLDFRTNVTVPDGTNTIRFRASATDRTAMDTRIGFDDLFVGLEDAVLPVEPGDILVADISLHAVVHVDPISGDRTILSGAGTGTGTSFISPLSLALESSGDILVTDNANQAIFRVDPTTGDRTILSGSGTGTGTSFVSPRNIALESNGDILVTDVALDAILRVDPTNGNRTILSGLGTGTGTNFNPPDGLALESSGDILVTDTRLDAIFRVDPTTGNRTILSDAGTGTGTNFVDLLNIALESSGDILVSDSRLDAILRVDPTNGNRTILSDPGTGTGASFSTLRGLALESSGDILGTDASLDAIFRVDPITGDRTILSDPGTGLGPSFIDPHSLIVIPQASTSSSAGVPEPSTLMLAVGGCLLLLRLRRGRAAAMRGLMIVFALSGVLFCGAGSASAVILQTGNFLQNPGAELGSTLFWTTGGDAPSPIAVESSSVSLSPGGSISPTEGTRFFVGGSGDQKTAYIEQDVSVGSFDFSGGLTTVSYGGDAQGITNRVPQSGSARAQYDIFFLDGSSTQIGTHSSGLVLDGSVTPEANLDFRTNVTVPDGTNTIRFRASATDRTAMDTRIGFDDLFVGLEDAVLPVEPGDILVTDTSLNAVVHVDPTTGDRTILSGAGTGAGPSLGYLRDFALESSGDIVVVDTTLDAIIRIDPTTGNRTILSGSGIGTGTSLSGPIGIALESSGDILVTDEILDVIIRVDPTTGNRTIVTGSGIGTGTPLFLDPYGIALETSGDILVSLPNLDAIIRVDPTTGNRTIVSDDVTGTGTELDFPFGLAQESNGDILVTEVNYINRVDLTTGNRTILSGSGIGSGTSFSRTSSIALESSGDILLADEFGDAIFRVDPITGDRTIISDDATGLGPLFQVPEFLIVIPEASTSSNSGVPEPSTLTLAALGFLALLKRRRRRAICDSSNM